jgi:hypothetical protein
MPTAPLEPILTCTEPTFGGLCKLFAVGHPSLGIFATDGGHFIGGHGMSDDNKLRTATGLSPVWDGDPICRVRAGDGPYVLPGRRSAVHLMVQPDLAAIPPTDGQGRALSAHTSKAYEGYAKRTMMRALVATRKRHAHRLATASANVTGTEFQNGPRNAFPNESGEQKRNGE